MAECPYCMETGNIVKIVKHISQVHGVSNKKGIN